MRTAVSFGLCAIGVITIILSATMTNPLQQPIGPGYVPLCVSVCLTVLCIAETFLNLRKRRPIKSSADGAGETGTQRMSMKQLCQNSQWLMAAVLIFVSILVWNMGGYLLGMIVGVIGLTSVDRKIKTLARLPYAAFLALALWFIFKVLLKTDLG